MELPRTGQHWPRAGQMLDQRWPDIGPTLDQRWPDVGQVLFKITLYTSVKPMDVDSISLIKEVTLM